MFKKEKKGKQQEETTEEESGCCCHEEEGDCGCRQEEGGCDCQQEDGCDCEHGGHEDKKHDGCCCQEKEPEKKKDTYEELQNKYLMALADLRNSRIMVDKEKEMMRKFYFQMTLENLFPVLDAFEMAFKMPAPNKEADNYLKGFEYIHQMLKQMLIAESVMEISPKVGDKFDSNNHYATEKIDVEKEEEDNRILEIYRKGYKLHDRVIRHSNVKVGVLKKNNAMDDTKKENKGGN